MRCQLCSGLQVEAPGVAVDDDAATILQGEDRIIDPHRAFGPVLDVQRKAFFRHHSPPQQLPHLWEVAPHLAEAEDGNQPCGRWLAHVGAGQMAVLIDAIDIRRPTRLPLEVVDVAKVSTPQHKPVVKLLERRARVHDDRSHHRWRRGWQRGRRSAVLIAPGVVRQQFDPVLVGQPQQLQIAAKVEAQSQQEADF